MALLLLVFAAVAALPCWFLYNGLRSGEVQAKGGSYRRSEDPGWFWTVIGVYAALIAWIAYLAADMALP